MSTLDDAARTALERLTALDHALASAEDAIEGCEREASDVERTLEPEWDDLERATESLHQQMARDAEGNADAVHALDGALGALGEALAEADEQAEDELEGLERGLEEMGDRARELKGEADERLADLRDRARQLEDRASRVQGELEDLLGETAALFEDELGPEIDGLRADIAERAEALETFLREECLDPLGEQCDAFSAQLEEYQAELSEAVEAAMDRTRQSVREALDTCREQFESEIEDLLDTCAAAMGAIDEAFESVTEGTSELLGMASATAELHDEHTRGFDGIRETLDHVRETFGRFSFLG